MLVYIALPSMVLKESYQSRGFVVVPFAPPKYKFLLVSVPEMVPVS